MSYPFGAGRGWSSSFALASSQRIVGNASGRSRPMIFIPGGAPIDLLPADAGGKPAVAAYAVAMTADGRVVGWSITQDTTAGALHCLVWTPGSAS